MQKMRLNQSGKQLHTNKQISIEIEILYVAQLETSSPSVVLVL